MNKLVSVLLPFTLMLFLPVYAGPNFPVDDHLESIPPPKIAAAQGDRVAKVEVVLYREAFGPTVRARVRVTTAGPRLIEVMSFITEENGRYRLVAFYSPTSVLEIAVPMPTIPGRKVVRTPDPAKVKVLRFTVDLNADVARNLIADWKIALQRASSGAGHASGLDGAMYTFSLEDASGSYAGRAWSAHDLPVLEALEKLADEMVPYCEFGATGPDKCQWTPSWTIQADGAALHRVLKARQK